MGILINLKGKKFGKLTVLDYCGVDKYGQTEWLCECECGNKTIVRAYSLKSGRTTSCGCRKHERFSDDLTGKQTEESRNAFIESLMMPGPKKEHHPTP